jgi:hypothetical protein
MRVAKDGVVGMRQRELNATRRACVGAVVLGDR